MRNRFVFSLLMVSIAGCLSNPVSVCGKENHHRSAETASAAPAAPAPASAPASSAPTADDISLLKDQLAAQQKQIEQLRQSLEKQSKMLEQALQAPQPQHSSQASTAGAIQALGGGNLASAVPMVPTASSGNKAIDEVFPGPRAIGAGGVSAVPFSPPAAGPGSPLSFKIGDAYITPVGFMDFTGYVRSHDGGSTIGTNFAGIPYGNVFQNNLSEFRLSMQNSRIGFRVDAKVHEAHVIGYMESDFLGNNPGNVEVSSNSNTLRSRLYWVDVRKNHWEVLGGQTWTLLTPGRTGISPLPGDIFFSQNMDVNYQVGLFWGRIPELRFVYHPSKKAAFAFALDSPEQYVGGSAGGGTITFPAALAATYANELNTGGNTFGVPNVAPDIIAKLALDPFSKLHFEVGGIERNFKVWNPTSATTFSAAGGGGFVNLNFELFKGFRVLTNNFFSDGGGRYIFGQAPDLIAHADGSISLIHADSTVTGFEYTHKNTLVFGYYGGLYIGRNVAIDTTGKRVGYGYAGSPSGQNRAIQEGTFGLNQTIWKDAKYGALNLISQYSYLTRNPWYVAAGQPSNASLNMVFVNLRYTLPGAAPAMK